MLYSQSHSATRPTPVAIRAFVVSSSDSFHVQLLDSDKSSILPILPTRQTLAPVIPEAPVGAVGLSR